MRSNGQLWHGMVIACFKSGNKIMEMEIQPNGSKDQGQDNMRKATNLSIVQGSRVVEG